jgi:uncharacterized SAM-binding protein YcdF (DUF218 family)
MLFIAKLLPDLLYPVNLICLMLVAVLATIRRRPRVAQTAAIVGLAILLLASDGWVGDRLMFSLESQVAQLPPGVTADAIVVLGGVTGAASPPRNITHLDEGAERLTYAALLYTEGRAPFLIVSGGRGLSRALTEPTESQEMADFLEMCGVPSRVIIKEDVSRSTDENARMVKRVMVAHGFKHVILVTSAMHMPRALQLFRQCGIDPIPAPTDYRVLERGIRQPFGAGYEAPILHSIPNSEALEMTTTAMHEYLGLAFYGWRGEIDTLLAHWRGKRGCTLH